MVKQKKKDKGSWKNRNEKLKEVGTGRTDLNMR